MLLAVLPVLCTSAAGSPLRAPERSLLLAGPLIGPLTLPYKEPGDASPDDLTFDISLVATSADAYAGIALAFPPVSRLAGGSKPEFGIITDLDTEPYFGERLVRLPDTRVVSLPFRLLLRLSNVLGDTEPPDILLLIAGFTGLGIRSARKLPGLFERKVAEYLRRVHRPHHVRVRIQQRKMA